MNRDYLTILPALLTLFGISIYALLATIYMSGTSFYLFGTESKFVGFQNYIDLFTSTRFINSLILTGLFCIGVFIQLLLGFIIALFLNIKIKVMSILRGIITWPMLIPPVAVGLTWKLLFDPTSGPINYILNYLFKASVDWFSPSLVIISLIIIDTWEWTPLFCLMMLAGLQTIPSILEEQAKIDGLSFWTRLKVVVLPRLKILIFLIFFLRLIDGLKTFDIVYSTTMGGPGNSSELLCILNYLIVFRQGFVGYGAALSLTIFLILWILGNFLTSQARKVRG